MKRLPLQCVLLALLFVGVARAGTVTFEAAQVVRTDGSAADTRALVAFEIRLWDRWLHQDPSGYEAMLSPDVTRFSGRAPGPQYGAAQVTRELKREWSAFERPGGVISESMRLQHAVVHFDGRFATVEYTISVKGGARWSYTDLGLVFQVLERDRGSWRVVHQTDTWSLDFDPASGTPGRDNFSFSFVYPAADLDRATAFYRPLLGAPESASPERRVFNVQGMRFVLERGTAIRQGWPNGQGILQVDDLARWRKKLAVVREGTRGADLFLTSRDSAGNLFTLVQVRRGGRPRASVRGLQSKPGRAVLEAWLRQDAPALAKAVAPGVRWFDGTRVRTRGVEVGSAALTRGLQAAYWPRFEQNEEMRATVSGERSRRIGRSTLVTFQVMLEGVGAHPFRERASVATVVDADNRVAEWVLTGDNQHDGLVLEFDYSGVPVDDMRKAQAFYGGVLGLGKPYRDQGWRGWWSDRAVYGVYKGPLRPGHANGYVSFWVRSVDEVMRYLKAHGSTFPVIESITSTSGIDDEPGYRQVYATDSEGNGVVFTEYTGRRR